MNPLWFLVLLALRPLRFIVGWVLFLIVLWLIYEGVQAG